MTRKMNPFNPVDWFALGVLQQTLAASATETIMRRSALMGAGQMNMPEAAAMMMEKPTAIAKGFEKATIAAARGQNVAQITSEFLKPMTTKASSNAKRLRK